jgi:uncharacterized coiled-coil protein SlyX
MAKTQSPKQSRKRQPRVGDAAFSPPCHLHAAPAGRKSAGVFAFNCTSPLGILLVRAGYQPQSSVARRALRLAQQAKTLRHLFHAQALMRRVIAKLKRRLCQLVRRLRTPQRPTVRKPIPLRPLFVQHNSQRCAPPSKRKAKAEAAEGDAESHSERWFASVVPRLTRAPNFPTFVATSG